MKTKSSSEWKAIAEAMDRAIHEGSLEMVTINVPKDLTQQTLVKFMQFFEQQMTRGLLMAKVEYRLKYLVDPIETVKVWVRNLYDSFLTGEDLRTKPKEKLQFVMQIISRFDTVNGSEKNAVLHGVTFRLTKFRQIPSKHKSEELSWQYPDSPVYTYHVFVTETPKPLSDQAQQHALENPSTTHSVETDLYDAVGHAFKRLSEGTRKTSFIVELRALEGIRESHFRYIDVAKGVADSAATAVRRFSEVLLGSSFKSGDEAKALMDQQLVSRCQDFKAGVMHMLIHGLVNYFGYGPTVEGEPQYAAFLKLEFSHYSGSGAFNTLNVVSVHASLVHPLMITKQTQHEIAHHDQYPDLLYYRPTTVVVRYQKFARVAPELPVEG
jgi:hypothetical protein